MEGEGWSDGGWRVRDGEMEVEWVEDRVKETEGWSEGW